MVTIRDLFHKVGNCHNKISVAAGLTKAELKELLKSNAGCCNRDKSLRRLSELESHAVEASKVLNQLRDIVYGIVDPDTGKPKK